MSFVAFARACGVDIRRLYDDGRIHRCPTLAHPRSDNGAYAFDGRRGWVMAWDGGGETHWYDDPNAKPWTDAQRAEWKRRQDDERRRKVEKWARAAQRAEELIKASSLQEHGYLKRKGFGGTRGLVLEEYTRIKRVKDPAGDRFESVTSRDVLCIPMRSLAGRVVGAQMIYWDGQEWVKDMVPGTRGKGAVLSLGLPAAGLTVLCEGFATGLSIQAAMHQMKLRGRVLVCFSDSNMVYISESLDGPVIVSADNDVSGAGERAAKATKRPYFMAPTVGHDANDWHQSDGLVPLCAAVMRARAELEAVM